MITKVNVRKFIIDLIKSWTIVEFRDSNGSLEEALREMKSDISDKIDTLLDHPTMTKEQFKESFKPLTEVNFHSSEYENHDQKEAIGEANIGGIIWDTVIMLRVSGMLDYEQSYERKSSKIEINTEVTYSVSCPYCQRIQRVGSKESEMMTCNNCGLKYDSVLDEFKPLVRPGDIV